jgi:S-adenosylmethionine synthetase
MTTQIFPAEFIFPGHPDKLCDAIADSLVFEAWKREPRALVGVEVAVHRDHIYVTGRIGCSDSQSIDVNTVVTDVYRSAGYDDEWFPSPSQVKIISNLCLGPLEEGEAEFRELSDDQAICVGYANNLSATNHLPVEQWLVGRLAKRLYALRKNSPELLLGPDGKVLVFVERNEQDGIDSWKLVGFSCSLQQKIFSDEVALHRAVRLGVETELKAAARIFPALSTTLPDQLTVNGAGSFEVGGPEGDNGLSGKKLVVDAYGPRIPIGGGAWSGKDFFKADRAGGLHARRVAKTIVRLGLAAEVIVTLGWFPGDRSARLISLVDDRGRLLDVTVLAKNFDLSLLRSGTGFPVDGLVELARWGHFSLPELPWEKNELI